MRNITAADIRYANAEGLADRESYWDYYTPTLNMALNLGRDGISLQDAPVVSGVRYGTAPDCGISHNYRDDRSERGLSLAYLDGQDEVGSAIWFAARKTYSYTGVLLPYKGSDGEPLILAIGLLNIDNIDVTA